MLLDDSAVVEARRAIDERPVLDFERSATVGRAFIDDWLDMQRSFVRVLRRVYVSGWKECDFSHVKVKSGSSGHNRFDRGGGLSTGLSPFLYSEATDFEQTIRPPSLLSRKFLPA